jgi:hypothetical protein
MMIALMIAPKGKRPFLYTTIQIKARQEPRNTIKAKKAKHVQNARCRN